MDKDLLAALERRRNKAISVIMRAKEAECDDYLPDDVSVAFRKVILDQVNELFDSIIDLIRFSSGSFEMNEEYLQRKVEQLLVAAVESVRG